jgi:hypothetical protein
MVCTYEDTGQGVTTFGLINLTTGETENWIDSLPARNTWKTPETYPWLRKSYLDELEERVQESLIDIMLRFLILMSKRL